VRCGNGLVAIDYDDEDAALRASEVLGDSLVNKAGRRGWTAFFRADFPVPSEDFVDANGTLALQVLGVGRQTVLPPSVHPDTGQPYRWTNGKSLYDTPLDALPELPADYRERLLALGYQSGRAVKEEPDPSTDHDGPTTFEGPHAEINAQALANMLAWLPELNLHNFRRVAGYQTWTAVATWRASQHRLEDRKNNLRMSAKHGIVDFGDGWKGYSPLDLVMAAKSWDRGTAFEWLSARVTTGQKIDFDALASANTPQQEKEAPPEPQKKRRIVLLPYDAPDPKSIPRREWLYGQHYMRKIVSATIGPGGIGKSSLGLVEAITMDLGLDLFNNKAPLKQKLRVWYHNGEDPRDEINRRIAAICIHYGLDEQEVRQGLFVTCGLDMPVKVASGNGMIVLDTSLRREIANEILAQRVDVIIFDPLVTLHSTTENNAAAMDPVIRDIFGVIANETNCAIELAHHTRKKAFGQEEFTVADARGSGSIHDAVRGMRVTNQMSAAQAEAYDIPDSDRESYLRVSRGKGNMVKPRPDRWYHFASVVLPNGDPEHDLLPDDVGVLETWTPPDISQEITDDDRLFFRTSVATGEFRYDPRAQQWVGVLVAKRLRFDLSKPAGKKRARGIIEALLEEGTLALIDREDGTRRMRTYVVPGPVPDGAYTS
jgi:hypothetical protein